MTGLFSRLLLVLLPATALAQLPQPVLTDQGLLQGTTIDDGGISLFRGVPYAAAPVGPLRWQAPQPGPTWAGIRMADRFGPRCVQGGFAPGAEQPLTSEDCLYLNIWTPADDATAGLPVMVWIHGGGFFTGAGSAANYDGAELAARGAVVVTINYRLGSFGFFAHPALTRESPTDSSGNYALLDMIASLQWLKANIGAFGGDPDNITLMGESAGAKSVATLVLSPAAEGLFERAILQSAGWMGWSGLDMGGQKTLAAAQAEGLAQMQAFGAGSLADLRAASARAIAEGFPPGGDVIVDGHVLPADASVLLTRGQLNPVDILAGSNRNEAVFFGPGIEEAGAYRDHVGDKYGPLAERFLTLYPAGSDGEANQSYLQAWSDEVAWQMQRLAAGAQGQDRQGWVYYFTQVPPGQEARGATHVAELHYMFNHISQNPDWDADDRALADRMAGYWVNFARSGNPNDDNLADWPAFDAADAEAVRILGESAPLPRKAALELFDEAFQNLVDGL